MSPTAASCDVPEYQPSEKTVAAHGGGPLGMLKSRGRPNNVPGAVATTLLSLTAIYDNLIAIECNSYRI
jgi:hypothetical protein